MGRTVFLEHYVEEIFAALPYSAFGLLLGQVSSTKEQQEFQSKVEISGLLAKLTNFSQFEIMSLLDSLSTIALCVGLRSPS